MSLTVRQTLLALEQASAPSTPSSGLRLLYPKSDGWYQKDSAGTETKLGTATGTKVSALTAIGTPLGAMELPVNDAGTSKKITLGQINTYVDPASNGSSAAQTLGTGDTYITGSDVTFNAGRLQAKSFYRAVFDLTKTAAGVATGVITLRMGTLGTTSDAAILTFTFPSAQTAAIDSAEIMVRVNMRTVGSGTSATCHGEVCMYRTNTTTGFISTSGLAITFIRPAVSSGFNSTTVTKMGLSANGGASSAWTIQDVQADVKNLAA